MKKNIDTDSEEEDPTQQDSPISRARAEPEGLKAWATQKSCQAKDLPFVKSLDGQLWYQVNIDSEYVPKIGTHLKFTPAAKRKNEFGNILAIGVPCGRGKSFAFREYMRRVIDKRPSTRILLLSANILYGTNLAHELKQSGFNAGFYKDKETNLANFSVVVCSLESLHQVEGQRFDVMLIDEVRTISGLVGGETMRDFANLFLLRELCTTTKEVVVCDADLQYKSHASEPLSAVHDFLKFIAQGRSVVCAKLTHPGPGHLRRSARLFYDNKLAQRDKKAWMTELENAAVAWHTDHNHRFAVCVGSKKQLQEVCTLLQALKVPFKPYSGDTHDEYRLEDLKTPDEAWVTIGAVVSTTTLSIGVDPKSVQFARVFVWTCRMGCNVLTQAQAAQRYGRSATAPLLNNTIDILMDCLPPHLRAQLVEAGKREPAAVHSYEDEMRKLEKRRGKRLAMYTRLMNVGGGMIGGIKQPTHVDDQILRLMTHSSLERICQMSDIHDSAQRSYEPPALSP